MVREFTVEELSTYNGVDGSPVYVGYRGIVYDLSQSAMWSGGDHEGFHVAGSDLTAAHDDAPHDEYILDYPVVGKLV